MNFTASSTTDQNRIERLLSALEGVVSASVVLDGTGRLVEIHILASHEMHPKQIVRNVESALSAGLGILVDRRVISVAQLRPDATQLPIAAADLDEPRAAGPHRHQLTGIDTAATAPLDATCAVRLLCNGRTVTGNGAGANTPQGRAEAAARALFDALDASHANVCFGFEGATLVDLNGRPHVLVVAHSLEGRDSRALTGLAAITRSPEEAAILASLQATNRSVWTPS